MQAAENRFHFATTWKIMDGRILREMAMRERKRRKHDFAFNSFLPGLKNPAVHFERFNSTKIRFIPSVEIGRPVIDRSIKFTNRASNRSQETNFDAEFRRCANDCNAFRLHEPAIAGLMPFAVGLGIYHAEIPSLAVLHRRRPVRIKHVALVEDGVRDVLHKFPVHRCTVSSVPASTRSTTCSQVGIPWRTLY